MGASRGRGGFAGSGFPDFGWRWRIASISSRSGREPRRVRSARRIRLRTLSGGVSPKAADSSRSVTDELAEIQGFPALAEVGRVELRPHVAGHVELIALVRAEAGGEHRPPHPARETASVPVARPGGSRPRRGSVAPRAVGRAWGDSFQRGAARRDDDPVAIYSPEGPVSTTTRKIIDPASQRVPFSVAAPWMFGRM